MLPVGFIQGRLSPKPSDRIQAFPRQSWREEFSLARECGFDCIELIHDELYLEDNPLETKEGQAELRTLAQKFQIRIGSICADYFMVRPLVENVEVAMRLLQTSKDIGCDLVEFPFVDSSSLLRQKEDPKLQRVLSDLASEAARLGLRIAIETDLPPVAFRDYLQQLPENVGANLDLGNSAALGFDVRSECRAFGERIFNVHIKDRLLGGTTVPLLSGNTDFSRAFAALAECRYRGDLVLQTAPDPDYVGVAKKYLRMTKDWSAAL